MPKTHQRQDKTTTQEYPKQDITQTSNTLDKDTTQTETLHLINPDKKRFNYIDLEKIFDSNQYFQ